MLSNGGMIGWLAVAAGFSSIPSAQGDGKLADKACRRAEVIRFGASLPESLRLAREARDLDHRSLGGQRDASAHSLNPDLDPARQVG